MGETEIWHWLIALTVFLLIIYWLLDGIRGLFHRYNALLVIIYLVFLTPLALIHAFLIGFFGDSEEDRRRQAIEDEAEFQLEVEKEKARRKRQGL